MFEVDAHHVIDTPAKLGGFNAYAVFESEEERDAALARFPKFVRCKASALTANFDGTGYTRKPTIRFNARFYEEANNPANETGAKRVRRFLELAGEVTFKTPYKNSFRTLAEATALLPN